MVDDVERNLHCSRYYPIDALTVGQLLGAVENG